MTEIECKKVKEFLLASCPENIKIDLGLESNTDYAVVITDKFNSKIRFESQTDDEGVLELTVLNSDVFNPFAGTFQLEIFKEECRVTLIACNEEIDEAHLIFVKYSGEIPEAIVKCECVEE